MGTIASACANISAPRDCLGPQPQQTRAEEMKLEKTFSSVHSLAVRALHAWNLHLLVTKRAKGLDFKYTYYLGPLSALCFTSVNIMLS